MIEEKYSGILIEAPITGNNSADVWSVSSLYHEAQKRKSSVIKREDENRLYKLLEDVSSYHFQPNNPAEPYREMLGFEYSRSANLSDLQKDDIHLLKSIVDEIFYLPLKARIQDILWFLDRSKYQMGVNAVQSYLQIISDLNHNELVWDDEDESNYLNYRTIDILRRALQINSSLSMDLKTEDLKPVMQDMRQKALASQDKSLIRRTSKLDIDFLISAPEDVAHELENYLSKTDGMNHMGEENLHGLTARAFQNASIEDKKWEHMKLAAEALVKCANAHDNAMQKSHWLSAAIHKYRGIPNSKERRKELKHLLIDIQADLNDEFHTLENKQNISENINNQRSAIEGLSVFQILKVLAFVTSSRDRKQLEEDAKKNQQENLLSIIGVSTFHDREGKVKNRTQASNIMGEQKGFLSTISTLESYYRNVVVTSSILPILSSLQREHYLSEDLIDIICMNSHFIPLDHQTAYKIGFLKFFQGDLIAALSILIPQFENSVRYVLKSKGHDTSSFDDVTQTQEDRPLSSIFGTMKDELNNIFGENTVFEIELVYLSKAGPNFRNEIAHGLVTDGEFSSYEAIYACWFIFRLTSLPLRKYWEEIESLLD